MPTPRDPLMDTHFLPLAWESSLGVKLALSVPPSPVTRQQTARAVTSIAAGGVKDKSPARKKVHRSRVDLKTLLQKSEPLETGPETPRIKTFEEPCELDEALGADLGAVKETPVRPRHHPKETVWSPLPLLKLAAQTEASAAQKKELVEWGSPIAPQRRLERQQTAERAAFDRQWERAAELHEQPPDQSLFYYAYCLDKVEGGVLGAGRRCVMECTCALFMTDCACHPLSSTTSAQAGREMEALSVYRAVLDEVPDCWAAAFNVARLLSQSLGASAAEVKRLLEKALAAQLSLIHILTLPTT